MSSKPYVTGTELKQSIENDFQIAVVATEATYKKAAVWYGAWEIRIPPQRGEPERILIAVSRRGTPEPRTIKTANGLISLMNELGFDAINIPMEAGQSSTHQLGQAPAPDNVRSIAQPPVKADLKSALLNLQQNHCCSVHQARALIASDFAVPISLAVRQDGGWPVVLDSLELSQAGRAALQMIGSDDASSTPGFDGFERVITEDYIVQEVESGTYAAGIICAKEWHEHAKNVERSLIDQPPIKLFLRNKRRA